jgi:hypothetical protein
LPDNLRALVSAVRGRLRARSAAQALTAGAAVFALLLLASLPLAASIAVAMIVSVIIAALRWRIDGAAIARTIETRHSIDNLLITAMEIDERPRPLRAEIRDAIWQQAAERTREVRAGEIVPLTHPMVVAAAVLIASGLLARIGDVSTLVQRQLMAPAMAAPQIADIVVQLTPPAYTKRTAETHTNPTQLTVIAGTVIRIAGAGRVIREWTATASESLEVRPDDTGASRLLLVTVTADQPPSVRITAPGRDAAYASPNVAIHLDVDGRDDLGLTSLTLQFTKASGGGENVTFTDGEVPMTVERVSDRQWRARGQWSLDPLGLAEGDVLVYRAIARDTNPNGQPVESDAFLIEIGKTAEIASAGFALPSEEKKYAISQQMVIYKTEQLIKLRQDSGATRFAKPEEWLEQTRMIGMEQRMVRAEVVFLSGGEVQDEVEEAAHSHELAEGRLENQGRAEMVRALNFMSRAEAQLNDGNATEALVFERQALASLERALDRRRYFLRTLPDRSRIDTTRRLTGERAEARSWTRARAEAPPAIDANVRLLIRDLAAAAAGTRPIDAALAARVAAIDPQLPVLQKSAIAVAAARTSDDQRAAVRAAMDAVASHALANLPGAAAVYLDRDPLAGRLADESAKRPRR